jgi:hypothetical protein
MEQARVGAILLGLAGERAGEPGRAWLDQAARGLERGLPRAFSEAGRRLGKAPLRATKEEAASLAQAGLIWSLDSWAVDDAARAGLLASFSARMPAARLEALVAGLWRAGATRERAAVARALPLLPDPSRFLPMARAAARSEVAELARAAACDNPYPALHFPDDALRRLAARAQTLGVAPKKLLGVERRLTHGLGNS